MYKIPHCLLFIILFVSCSQTQKDGEKDAWFGGEIINPITDHVILTKNDILVDTIPLDDNNRFIYKIKEVEKGLYNFIHNEYQIIYIEPGDSLLIRLNTVEFDESLAFTGKGAERNKYLIDMFLHNENENQRMTALYQLPPEDFIPKLDSMKQVREGKFKQFIKKAKPCSPFKEIVVANINYDYYTKKELYPFAHAGMANVNEVILPDNYYSFRTEIDYNNEYLQTYYTYFRFLLRHFDNLAFEKYRDSTAYNDESYLHISHKLNEINRLVTLNSLKDNLLQSSARKYILNSKNEAEEKELLKIYYSLSTNERHKKEISTLAEASFLLMPGNRFPNITLLSFDQTNKSIHSVIKKPSVIFFWSQNSANHYRNIHSKAAELEQKYPEFDFIAINTDLDHERWKKIVQRNNYNTETEFRFQNVSNALNVLVINTINKAMIVDRNGEIIDSNTNLFSLGFEEQLLGILNQ